MSNGILKEIKEWVLSIIIAAAIAFIIKGFLIDIIQVSGTSMLPNLSDRDRLLIEKVSLYTHNYERGEIIIFKPNDETKDIYIKRIIGLPGDRVEIKNGEVYVNSEKLDEKYLKSGMYTAAEQNQYNNLTVPENCLYVLGDNRTVSEDSRYIGPIPIENIRGHAVLRVYPFNDFKKY